MLSADGEKNMIGRIVGYGITGLLWIGALIDFDIFGILAVIATVSTIAYLIQERTWTPSEGKSYSETYPGWLDSSTPGTAAWEVRQLREDEKYHRTT